MNKIFRAKYSPPLQGGVDAPKARTGRLSKSRSHRTKERFADIKSINRPVCAANEASQHFLGGAATPPWKGGEYIRERNSEMPY
jgi:hypothetical protein